MYAFGIGVDRDLARGLQLLEAAAQTKELAPKAKAHAALACRDSTSLERDLCRLHARN
jgi:TPR repeat protein